MSFNDEHLSKIMTECCAENNSGAIRNILTVNRSLLNGKMFGYEGSDLFETIKNVRIVVYIPHFLLNTLLH